ncbi:YqgE/AlgH family protein [Flavimarina sp. Hel_I_48]|uniref:YqgE/AlgH family protein n=1 Tax=Flavimarina sp. Hel_I_48 TaxID=1392488 RepID=UPI0004DF9A7F|nr:YqgE/AlgH family protein [Flavimarina sp. Hel_I_48]
MITKKATKGKLLVAEPSILGDVSFNRSVILLANHDEQGSVGFILNKPSSHTLEDLVPEAASAMTVYNGGPVEQECLYFIHKVPDLIPNSVEIASGIYWGGDFNTVVELLRFHLITENDIRFFLGYSGWDGMQLDEELDSRSWIVVDNIHKKDIITRALPDFWRENMIELGGDYLLWSNAPENPVYN